MYSLVDDELEAQLVDHDARKRWLVLDTHPDFPGHWLVNGFTNDFLYDLGEIIGLYRALAPAGLQHFLEAAEVFGYRVAFFEDPTQILDQFAHLSAEPEVEIISTFDNTVKGMLPYQVQGYNLLKDLEYGVARWDTGTGKTVLASSVIKYHQELADFDICFFVVKKNNKVNTVRKLKKLGGIDALYIRGPKKQRERYYAELSKWAGRRHEFGRSSAVVVINYETFKADFVKRSEKHKLRLTEWGEAFFRDRDLLFVWDEMPTKLSTRTSELYKSICTCLYTLEPPKVDRRYAIPRSMRSLMLSATPVENNVEGWFNCVRIMDGGQTYGTVSDFGAEYVAEWSHYDPTKPYSFHNFERMRLKAAYFIHGVDKTDPDIAAVFPKAVEEPVYIDWDDHNRALYSKIEDLVRKAAEDSDFADVPIFSLIGTLQMLCDAPEMVTDSAARREIYEEALEAWEVSPEGRQPKLDGSEFALALPEEIRTKLRNDNHPKMEMLKELLLERHADDQVVIYTRFNKTLMPYLEARLTEWGVSYGRYAGTESQLQKVQDAFQRGDIRVFLSSDAGSDSIDLDAGNVVIDYNLPWKWTTLTQRHNRVHRPTSAHETVYYYSLIMEGSVEERTLQIIEIKKAYHDELFNPAAGDLSASARMTKDDLLYILTGR